MPQYAISKHYLPLINVEFSSFMNFLVYGPYAVTPRQLISSEEVLRLASNQEDMMCFNTLDEAKVAAYALLQGHNTNPQFIAKGVNIFASPVIFRYDNLKETNQQTLTEQDLTDYAAIDNIPLLDKSSYRKALINPNSLQLGAKELNNGQPVKFSMQRVTGTPSAAIYFGANLTLHQTSLWQLPVLRYATTRLSI